MLPPRSPAKDAGGEARASNGPAESARNRLRFMVLDKLAATPVQNINTQYRSTPLRAGAVRTGK
jgi:hypothetical protein